MGRHGLEKSVHIDLSPALGKVNVLLGRKILIAEKDHTEIRKRALNLFEYGSRESVGDIHTMDFGTDRTTQRMNLYVSIARVVSERGSHQLSVFSVVSRLVASRSTMSES